jgi:hypothetical protein
MKWNARGTFYLINQLCHKLISPADVTQVALMSTARDHFIVAC